MVNGLPFILVYMRGSTWDLNSNKKGSVNFAYKLLFCLFAKTQFCLCSKNHMETKKSNVLSQLEFWKLLQK